MNIACRNAGENGVDVVHLEPTIAQAMVLEVPESR